MRWTLPLVALFCVTGLCSAGLLQRIQQIGRRQKPELVTTATTTNTTTTTISPETTTTKSSKVATRNSGSCGGNLVIDLKSGKKLNLISNEFPQTRDSPYACSWDAKVTGSCKQGQISLKFEKDSRLPNNCSKGYVRVTPILQDVKVCGNISTLPELRWFINNGEENFNILMKNIGMNDGLPEGVSFSISGECLDDYDIQTDFAIINAHAASKWLMAASRRPGVEVISRSVLQPMAKLSPKVSAEMMEAEFETEVPQTEDTTEVPASPGIVEDYAAIETEVNKNPVVLSEDVKSAETSTKKPPTKTAQSATTTTTAIPTTSEKPQRTYVPLLFAILRRVGVI